MALQITTPFQLAIGTEVNEAYGRITCTDEFRGNKLRVNLDVFLSEEAYATGKLTISTPFSNIIHIDYNRAVDGVDSLDFAHNAMITHLATQGIQATKKL